MSTTIPTKRGSELDVRTLTSAFAFEELGADWDALVHAMRRPSPFMLHAWLSEWWVHYGRGAALSVRTASRGGRLVAAAPLLTRSRFGVSVTGLLGGTQSALGDVLLAAGEDDSVTGKLLDVGRAEPGYLDAHGLPRGSRLAAALGTRVDVVERVEAPVLELHGGWDATYAAHTSSKKRNLHRRRRRQLGEIGRLETVVARDPDALTAALEDAFRLHALRWEGRPDGSDFASERGRAFQRAALQRLSGLDVARIVLLKLDGRSIAFHYYFAFEGRMFVHRLGFDPALARFSPGVVNTLDTLEAAASEGLMQVEYLGGAERYKVELADRFDPLCRAVGLARGLRAHALVRGELLQMDARLRLKRSPTLRRVYFEGLAPFRRVVSRRATADA
jgi:CelD/BcsL family acetyltransferase involved in cellulose biosynthesis